MSVYAAKTSVSVEKTRAEIETTVQRYGADSFMSGWDGDRAILSFRAKGRYVRFVMVLPDRNAAEYTSYRQGSSRFGRTPEASRKLWDQACRQRWRALALMIKAKLEAVQSGIVTFEEEFLAHVQMPDGRTLYEHVKGPLTIAYESNQVQQMLTGPADA